MRLKNVCPTERNRLSLRPVFPVTSRGVFPILGRLMPSSSITRSASWQALVQHQTEIARTHLRELFAQDPGRFDRFSVRFEDVLLDYSKNRITARTFELLMGLAREAKLGDWVGRMFAGDKIN